MGTMIALLLVLSALAGCAGNSMMDVKSAPPPEEIPLAYTVELTRCEEKLTGEAGELLAECSYEVPVLRVQRADGTELAEASTPQEERALAAAETFNAQFSGWLDDPQNLENLKESARADRDFQAQAGDGSDFFVPYDDELSCTVYQTGHIVSVSGQYVSYTGGAHPNTMLLSWNFDLESGVFFEAEQLDQGSGLREAVQEELIRQAEQRGAESVFWPDFREILAEWSSYAVTFGEEGMTVAFSPYELACYAAGPQVFHISYEWLAPHLNQQGREFLGL